MSSASPSGKEPWQGSEDSFPDGRCHIMQSTVKIIVMERLHFNQQCWDTAGCSGQSRSSDYWLLPGLQLWSHGCQLQQPLFSHTPAKWVPGAVAHISSLFPHPVTPLFSTVASSCLVTPSALKQSMFLQHASSSEQNWYLVYLLQIINWSIFSYGKTGQM